jgi:hypothetical protein
MLVFSSIIFAQNKATVEWNGIVVDSMSKQPIAYCTVQLVNTLEPNKQFAGITDETGKFSFNKITLDEYRVIVRYVGYIIKTFSLNLNSESSLTDTIFLMSKTSELSGIEITASIFERDIDKLVMNASAVKLREGGNTVDLIKEVPGVEIRPDYTLTLIGKDVLILIDGKPVRIAFDKLSNLLSNQSSNDIAKIEIMFTPPPKYVDEWDGAILNIITKKNIANGIYGSIIILNNIGKHFRGDMGVDLNYRKSHFNSFISLGPRTSKRESLSYFTQKSTSTNETNFWQQSKRINQNSGYYLMTGLNYFPNKRLSIDLLYNSNYFSNKYQLNDSILYSPLLVADSLIISRNHSSRRNFDHEINLFVRLPFKNKKNSLNFEADYSIINIDKTQDRTYLYYDISDIKKLLITDQNRNSAPFKSNIFFFRSDLTYTIKKIRIECGAKWNKTHFDNDFVYENLNNGAWFNDSLQSNHFIFDEDILSGYINAGQQITTKFSYRLGLRASFTDQYGNSLTSSTRFIQNYFSLLPSLYFNYTINDFNMVEFQYDRKIQRPYYETLNPFVFYDNPLFYTSGNPNLKPATEDNFSVIHMFKSSLFSSFSYKSLINGIALKPILHSENERICGYIYENFSKQSILELSVSYFRKFFENRLKLSFTPNINYWFANNQNDNYSSTSLNYYLGTSAKYTIDDNSGWEVSFYNSYMSGFSDGYNRFQGMNKCGISMFRSFFNNKLNCGLELNDIFNTDNQNSTTRIGNLEYNVQNIPDSRYFRISVFYSFISKSAERYDRHEVDNEEKGRIQR